MAKTYREPPAPQKHTPKSKSPSALAKKVDEMDAVIRGLQTVETDDEKNVAALKIVANNLAFMRLGLQHPVSSDADLAAAMDNFFALCMQTNTLPTWEKFLIVCGRSAGWARAIMNGSAPGYSPKTKEMLDTVRAALASIDAELANNGSIDRVVYIFRAKHFYGITEKPDVVEGAPDPLGEVDVSSALRTIEELPDD